MMETLPKGRFPLILLPIAALAAALMLSACGGSHGEPPAAETGWEVRVESPLDTLDVPTGEAAAMSDTLGAADAGATPEARPEEQETVRTSEAPPTEPAVVPDAREFTPGWRVQIAALSSMAGAEEEAARARERFQEPVYVEYEPPLYKVRIGDFLVRGEAESLKTRALSRDYENAWVVETLVVKAVTR